MVNVNSRNGSSKGLHVSKLFFVKFTEKKLPASKPSCERHILSGGEGELLVMTYLFLSK